MAPRKNAVNTSEETKISQGNPPKKNSKKRVNEEKPPKQRRSTIVKAIANRKVPSKKKTSPCTVPVSTAPQVKLTAAQSKAINFAARKIELANEVALAQLVKPGNKSSLLTKLLEDPEKVEKPLVKKGHPKKLNNSISTKTGAKKNEVGAIQKVPKRGPAKKQCVKRKGAPNDQLSEEPVKKTRKKNVAKNPPKSSAARSKNNLTIELEPTVGNVSTANSPSLLDGSQTLQVVVEKAKSVTPTKEFSTRASPVNSRKTSSDQSCFSWTKDISSSSTNTSITATANDIVRIDSRMPFVQLNNIDDIVKPKDNNDIDDIVKPKDNNDIDDKEKPKDNNNIDDEVKPKDNDIVDDDIISSELESDSDSSNSTKKRTVACNSSDDYLTQSQPSLDLSRSTPTKSQPRSTSSITGSPNKTVQQPLNSTDSKDTSEMPFINQKPQLDLDFLKQLAEQQQFNTFSESEMEMRNDMFWPEEELSIITLCDEMQRILDSDSDVGEEVNEPYRRTKIVSNDTRKPEQDCKTVQPANDTESSIVHTATEDIDKVFAEKNRTDREGSSQLSGAGLSPRKSAPESCEGSSQSPIPPSDPSERDESDWHSYRDQSYANDDDDVLSLTAESITGLESSRMTSSAASICVAPPDFDEYIPEPTNTETRFQNSYNSKLAESSLDDGPKAVCGKQNAHSTLDTKETSQVTKAHVIGSKIPTVAEAVKPWPMLLGNRYNQSTLMSCQLLKGVCFFNLISNCKRTQCTYPHANIEETELLNRLSKFPDYILIGDYMFIRTISKLRRLYCLLFVREFESRGMTNALLEMVIDFTIRARPDNVEDSKLRTVVTEKVLEHLNGVDLNMCHDLLCFTIANGRLLCDILMEAIAETQNFSRFRMVFLNLANFILRLGRTFDMSVANKILERVCILPFDQALVGALCRVIFNTDAAVFDNPCMRNFEEYLLAFDKDFYEQFRAKKQQILTGNTEMPYNQEPDPNQLDREQRYNAPEITKVDNMNKLQNEKKCRVQEPPMSLPNFKIPCSSVRARFNMHYRSPLHRGGFRGAHRGFPFPRMMHRPPFRVPLKRNVVYQQVAANFSRRSGPPDFC